MSKAPWLNDPMYGGMSPEAARKSYQAWVAQGRPRPPWERHGNAEAYREPLPALSDAEIARSKLIVEDLLAGYESEAAAALAWWRDFKVRRQGRGFRAIRRQQRDGA